MTSRRTLLTTASALAAMTFAFPGLARADTPIPVVTTFSILGDMVERIGGEHVTVTSLVGRNGDAHVYQPTPKAARAVKDAEIMIQNGLEFEGWLDRLTEAAGFEGTLVVATTGIDPIAFDDEHDDHDDHAEGAHHDEDHEDHAEGEHHDDEHEEHAEGEHHDEDHEEHAEGEHHDEDHEEHAEGEHHDDDHEEHAKDEHHDEDHAGHDHGAFDPHAWLSLTNAVTYVDNITAALAQAAPSQAGTFYENRATFVAEIEALDTEIRVMMAALPDDRRTVVTSHDAFGYLGRDYDLSFVAPQGLSTESEASARDVAELIEHMREDGIDAVFLENVADSRMLEQIARETGATIGGRLYPGALSEADGPAASYLDLMRHNATTLAVALGS